MTHQKVEQHQRMMKWIFPILALFLMVIDGRLTMALATFSDMRNTCSVQLLVLLFIIGYFYFGNVPYLYIWTIIIGALYDLYYYGILGIHMFVFPMMIFILHHGLNYTPRTVPTYLMLFLLCSIWVMYASYFLQVIFGLTVLDFLSYMILYAAPTLLMSAIIDYTALIYGRRFFLHKSLIKKTASSS